VFKLQQWLLSSWLPIESEKCFYLSLGRWVHGFQLKVKSVFNSSLGCSVHGLQLKVKSVFYFSLGCWVHVVCVCGQLCNEGKGKREVEIAKNARWARWHMSRVSEGLNGCGKRTQKTTSFWRVAQHPFEKWCKMTYVQRHWVLPKQIPKATHPLEKCFVEIWFS
jgi:hypothetical protein